MNNVDIEIYVKQLIIFFENNPNDLIDLIGEENKDTFFDMIKKQCYKNFKNGEDISLTRNQLLDIAFSIKKGKTENFVNIVDGVYEKTRFGKIWLN